MVIFTHYKFGLLMVPPLLDCSELHVKLGEKSLVMWRKLCKIIHFGNKVFFSFKIFCSHPHLFPFSPPLSKSLKNRMLRARKSMRGTWPAPNSAGPGKDPYLSQVTQLASKRARRSQALVSLPHSLLPYHTPCYSSNY